MTCWSERFSSPFTFLHWRCLGQQDVKRTEISHWINCDLRFFWSLSHVSWARPGLKRCWSPSPSLTQGIWAVCTGWGSYSVSLTGSKTTRGNWIHRRTTMASTTRHRWNRSRSEKDWLMSALEKSHIRCQKAFVCFKRYDWNKQKHFSFTFVVNK